jgi:putative hydrolase of the HAD superfamily
VPGRQQTDAVLFDLDDTLFDHQRSARQALAAIRDRHACFGRWTIDEFDGLHSRFLEELHPHVIAGTIGMDEAREERFRRLFALAGVETAPRDLTETALGYRAAYVAARVPVDGAVALLAALKPRVRIGIVSNNMLEEQREKLEFCGFAPYVDELVVSEAEGISKPDPAIFRIALDRLRCVPERAVMIGDSWAADIEGARAAGIRAIWFNRTSLPPPRPSSDIITLTSFEPIEPVLEAIFPCVLA